MPGLNLAKSVVRASHSSWAQEDEMKPRYAPCITIDPSESFSSWSKLSEDTFALEIASYPIVLHRAFLKEVKKRAGDDRR
ncbi:hypothetical protein [Devosia sp.]|uniref:hypothetical protein n=1 Tax=Devosia sp. TaxID=1871048 RepID=UPI001B171913|nr:hypothetical protein [Devosia sp.]MBO9589568.1 hypothetical protein [Devosia sp.]